MTVYETGVVVQSGFLPPVGSPSGSGPLDPSYGVAPGTTPLQVLSQTLIPNTFGMGQFTFVVPDNPTSDVLTAYYSYIPIGSFHSAARLCLLADRAIATIAGISPPSGTDIKLANEKGRNPTCPVEQIWRLR